MVSLSELDRNMTSNEIKRKAYTSHLSTAINKLNTELNNELLDEVKIRSLVEQVEAKYVKLIDIVNILQEEMEAESLEADIDRMESIENHVIDAKVKAKTILEKLENAKKFQPQPSFPQSPAPSHHTSIKLPDIKLQEFHGDEEMFPSFIDQFTAIIDSNPDLTDVEKFSYLRGAAKVDIIQYFPMTQQNYKPALERLKQEYGDADMIAKKHLNALLDLSKRRKPSNNKELQELYSFIECKLACLEALHKPVDQHNEMLITLIYRQLPKTLKQKIAKLDTTFTSVGAVLHIIHEHIRTCKQMQYREGSSNDSDSDSDTAFQKKSQRKSRDSFQSYKTHTPFHNDPEDENNRPTSSATSLPVLSQRYKPCTFCEGRHSSIHCHKVIDIDQRKEIARKFNKCFNCLYTGHRQSECRSSGRCRRCNRKHHTALCSNQQTPANENRTDSDQARNRSSTNHNNQSFQGLTTATTWEANSAVLLQIAEAELRKPLGSKIVKANVFFDLGSQFSYLLQEVKNELDLDIVRHDVLEQNTFGRTQSETVSSEVVTVQILKNGFSKDITLHTSRYICGELPSFKLSKRKKQELGKITLAHPRCMNDGSHAISLLIGADLYWEFVGVESITTSFGMRANNSKLGWLLSGTTDENFNVKTATHLNIIRNVSTQQLKSMKLDEISPPSDWLISNYNETQNFNNLAALDTISYEIRNKKIAKAGSKQKTTSMNNTSILLNNFSEVSTDYFDGVQEVDDWDFYKIQSSIELDNLNLSWFWHTQHIGIVPEENEPTVLKDFENKLKYDKLSKRYQVSLPCKFDLIQLLPDNYNVSKLRLQSVLEKLNKPGNEELLKSYDQTFKDQLSNGIIEKVKEESQKGIIIHYLPHHCVIRKDKPTTSVRVVYDGSARAHKKAVSLNKCLHPGPSLVNNLAAVLLRFRMFKFAVVADIRKAFLQISIAEEDRDLTRFLWRDQGKLENPIETYRFCRVPFGLTSSPFLLHAVIIHHLNQFKADNDLIVNNLLKSTYVDDVLTGAETEDDALKVINDSNNIMKEASLELTKWVSNSPNLLAKSNIDISEHANETTIKLLGIKWNTSNDKIHYDIDSAIKLLEKSKPSKRTVLKIVAKLYDPHGYLSPFIVTGKIMFQKITKAKLEWDDQLPTDIMDEWKNWSNDLHLVNEFNLPRCVNTLPSAKFELVGFCDASIQAYSAVIYIRCIKDNLVNTQIIMSRSRVAPIKDLSIPRLELLGAVLLVRLMSFIKKNLSDWTVQKTSFYTDSSNVLYWIYGAKKWNSYISKRLNEIHELSSQTEWSHCPGEQNPADLATRGISMSHLLKSNLWFHGPEWLTNHELKSNCTSWKPTPSAQCLQEEKVIVQTHAILEIRSIERIISVDRYSSLRKLCKITAYILLFINICLKKEKKPMLELINKAEKMWVSNEQRKYFSKEISCLKNKAMNKKPVRCLVSQLDLFLDNDSIIRCAGRYQYSNLTYQRKYPILLPKESVITKLIVEDRHRRISHYGLKSTLTEVREEFWIPKGRRLIKYIINRCIVCRKINAKPFKAPPTPPLPLLRLSDMPPFTNTGVDFAGPLYCKERDHSNSHKSYIALFTCASTRALSLELVPDLTSHSFKNAMIRFISIRGIPNVMVSDNAKTFQKTAEDCQCLITRSPTHEFIETSRITWLFYLEKSPWWGGFIERMVSTVKSSLRKILQKSYLSYDEMSTLLKQIEACVNSRPITCIYDDDTEEPLTPSHLLIGKRATALPEVNQTFYDTEGRSKYREVLISQFMKRWKREYLEELQSYHISKEKVGEPERIPKIGEVVLMKEDKPRATWDLARITDLYKSRDNRIRSIEVRKANGNIARRPPQLLVPLEM